MQELFPMNLGLDKDLWLVMTILVSLSANCVGAAWCTQFLMAGEVYPTCVR